MDPCGAQTTLLRNHYRSVARRACLLCVDMLSLNRIDTAFSFTSARIPLQGWSKVLHDEHRRTFVSHRKDCCNGSLLRSADGCAILPSSIFHRHRPRAAGGGQAAPKSTRRRHVCRARPESASDRQSCEGCLEPVAQGQPSGGKGASLRVGRGAARPHACGAFAQISHGAHVCLRVLPLRRPSSRRGRLSSTIGRLRSTPRQISGCIACVCILASMWGARVSCEKGEEGGAAA